MASPSELGLRPRWLVASLLLLLGLVVGITAINSPGMGDVTRWLQYMQLARQHGVWAVYPIAAIDGVSGAATDYPPLALVILALFSNISWLFGGDQLITLRPDFTIVKGDFFALKVSIIAFTLACAVLMANWQGRWRPWLGAAMLAFLALDALFLAYIDVYFALFLLLAFYCFERNRPALGAVFYTLAFLTKWQPIILAPLILLYVIPRRPRPSDLARLVPAALVFLLVLALYARPMITAFGAALQNSTFSGSALNFNWLVSAFLEMRAPGFADTPIDTLRYGKDTLLESDIAVALARLSSVLRYFCYGVGIVYFYLSRRTSDDLLRASIACFMAYFVFGPGVHDNHAFVPSLLALCWLAQDRTRYVEAILLTVMFQIDLLIFYGVGGKGPGFSRVAGWDVTIYLAAFNVLVFAFLWLPIAGAVWSRLTAAVRALPADAASRSAR